MEKNDPTMRTALIAGASGLTGKECLYRLLESDEYTRIISVGRRMIPVKHHRLTQQQIDFSDPAHYEKLPEVDDVFCCLGTTIRDAVTRDRFYEVDFTYVINLARACREKGATQFLVVSALGANPDATVFYNRLKGEMEDELKTLGYPTLHIFRPALLLGSRPRLRPGEFAAQKISTALSFLFIGPIKKYKPIEASKVAKAMIHHALTNASGTHIHESINMV